MTFAPDTDMTEYKLDQFEKNDPSFMTQYEYDIADSMIHIFTVPFNNKGEKIYALYIGDTNRIKTDTVFVYCHGNSGSMDTYWTRAKMLANVGYQHRFGVLMMDYKGFGLSEGVPTEGGLNEDVNLCLEWLQKRGLMPNQLLLYGFSLGSGPATTLAADPVVMAPIALMLEAPFASTEVMANDASLLNMPASYYGNNVFDNAEKIKKVTQPFFWIHGTEDSYLAMDSHGEVIWKNYGGNNGTAVRVPGAIHSDIPFYLGPSLYMEELERFINGL